MTLEEGVDATVNVPANDDPLIFSNPAITMESPAFNPCGSANTIVQTDALKDNDVTIGHGDWVALVVIATVKMSGKPPRIVLYNGKRFDRSMGTTPVPPAGAVKALTTSPPAKDVAETSRVANEFGLPNVANC